MAENELIDLYRRLLNTPYGLYRFISQYCINNKENKNIDLKSFIVHSIIMMLKNTYISIHINIIYNDEDEEEGNNVLRKSINTVLSETLNDPSNNINYRLNGAIYINMDTNSSIPLYKLNSEELILLFKIISKDNRTKFFNTIEGDNGRTIVLKNCKCNKEIIDKYEDSFYVIEYFIFSLLYYQIFLYVSEINNNEILYSCVRSLSDIIISAMNTVRCIDIKYQQRYNNLVFLLSNAKTEDIIKIVSEWASTNIIPFLK